VVNTLSPRRVTGSNWVDPPPSLPLPEPLPLPPLSLSSFSPAAAMEKITFGDNIPGLEYGSKDRPGLVVIQVRGGGGLQKGGAATLALGAPPRFFRFLFPSQPLVPFSILFFFSSSRSPPSRHPLYRSGGA
jgi:hypothetical protein